jgi:thiamine kinase-like enzyme
MTDPVSVVAALETFAAGRTLLACAPHIQSVSGGLTNHTWRVTGGGRDWAVRVGTGSAARLGIDRRTEARVIMHASAAGFAPPVVHIAPHTGVLVTQFIGPCPWSQEEARAPAAARRLGARARELHGLDMPSGVPTLDLHDVLIHYLETAPPPAAPIARAAIAACIRQAIVDYRPAAQALCHHDLNHHNILDGPPLMFIDWEYAAIGDVALELAAYAQYHELGAPARDALLEGYGRDAPVSPAQLTSACVLFDCLHALWLDAADAWNSLDASRREALKERIEGGNSG